MGLEVGRAWSKVSAKAPFAAFAKRSRSQKSWRGRPSFVRVNRRYESESWSAQFVRDTLHRAQHAAPLRNPGTAEQVRVVLWCLRLADAINEVRGAGETPALRKSGRARGFDESCDSGEQDDHESCEDEKHKEQDCSDYEFSSSLRFDIALHFDWGRLESSGFGRVALARDWSQTLLVPHPWDIAQGVEGIASVIKGHSVNYGLTIRVCKLVRLKFVVVLPGREKIFKEGAVSYADSRSRWKVFFIWAHSLSTLRQKNVKCNLEQTKKWRSATSFWGWCLT